MSIESKEFDYYQKELEDYVLFYNEVIKVKEPTLTIMEAIERSFYNCLAISGKLSIGINKKGIMLCLEFVEIAEKLMYLSGLNETPDEMPYVLIAIKINAIQCFSEICQSEKYCKDGLSEKEYEKIVTKSFSTIEQFNKYEFKKNQVILPDGDVIDILAEDIISKRPVIIELKRGNKSGHKQLRSYAVHYKNPILINVSVEEPLIKRKDIIYYLFEELGIEHLLTKQE